MEKIVCNSTAKLIDFIRAELPNVGYGLVHKLLRSKDIKVNGKRVNKDILLKKGDQVDIYLPAATQSVEVVYKDDNIVVVNKPKNIVVCDSKDSLESLLTIQLQTPVYAVHRLDQNTSGLVVFALNKIAEKDLLLAFKNHTIKKYYLAKVVGVPKSKHKLMVAYLKKDSEKSQVYISQTPKEGYTKIITEYTLKSTNQITSILEVNLHTGKTHQIRAHLSSVGLPIVGDNKYGDKQFNKQAKKSKQQLFAYKIILDGLDNLAYLNGKKIELDCKNFN